MSNEINIPDGLGSFLDNKLHLLNNDLDRNTHASECILTKLRDIEDPSLREILEHLKIREKVLTDKIFELSKEKLKLKQDVVKEISTLISSQKLISLTVLFGAIIIVAAIFYAAELVQEKTSEIIAEKTERLKMISTQMESDLIKLRSEVEASASLPQVQDVSFTNLIDKNLHGIPFDADPQKRQAANDILRNNKDILAVFFVLPNGDMYLGQPYHGQENMKDSNFAFRDWYKGVTKTHNTYTSELYVSQITDTKAIAIATPVYSDSKYVGIWSIILNVDYFPSRLQPEKNEQLIIIDKNENIIYDSLHTDLTDERITKLDYVNTNDGVKVTDSTNNVQIVHGVKSLVIINGIHTGNDYWKAIIIQPYDDAFSITKIFSNLSLFATGSFILIVLALCMCIVLKAIKKSKQIQKNIEQLEKHQSLEDVTRAHIVNQVSIRKINPNKKIYILIIIAVSLVVFNTYTSFTSHMQPLQMSELKSGFVIENLKGDTVDTWTSWNISPNRVLDISFVSSGDLSQEQIDSIKNVILSDEPILIDDSITHKGPKGEESTYYVGWAGALKKASDYQTKLVLPTTFRILDSSEGAGDIVFHFSTSRSADGYTGYTNSLVDQNQILKVTITIYDMDELTPQQIGIIARHEFGHALGLAHSTAPEDLMAPIIATPVPYISECDISAIQQLYDGNENSSVICEK